MMDSDALPDDLHNYVLKPVFGFAGRGVHVGPERADIEAIAHRIGGSTFCRSGWISGP
jgi:hypothetical protein